MRVDDLAGRAAVAAHESTAGTTPLPVPDLARISRRRSRVVRGLVVSATAAGLVIVVGVAGLIGDRRTTELGISDPVTTLTAATVATSTPPPDRTEKGIEVVVGIDTTEAKEMPPLLYPGAILLTDSDLTAALIADVRAAASGLHSDLDRDPPHMVQVAFEKNGQIYATVAYGTDGTGLLVIEDDEISRAAIGYGTWVNTHIVRRPAPSFSAFVQVTWLGLPEHAVTAHLAFPEPARGFAQLSVAQSIEEQAVIGNAAFFEIAKPDWNQIGTLTLEAADGSLLATEEVLLDGGGCSAWRENPNPPRNPSLSDELNAARARLASAAVGCDLSLMADLAVADGPYFDAPVDSLIDTVRDADRRRALMLQILRALQLPPREQELDGRTIYTWGAEHTTLAFDADGTWLYATINDP